MTKYLSLLIMFSLFIGIIALKHFFFDQSTRICSWNIRFFGLKIENDVGTHSYFQYISNYIKELQPDILCLQEISSHNSIIKLQKILKDYDLYVSDHIMENNKKLIQEQGIENLLSYIGDPSKDIGGLQFNVFLVRKNINVIDFHTVNRKMICLNYKDKHTGQPFTIYNCHFPSDFSGDNTGERSKSIMTLFRDIKKHNYKNIVIAGDLNTEKRRGELASLENKFVDVFDTPLATNRHVGLSPIYTHRWDRSNSNHPLLPNKYSHIDYFFVSRRILSRVKDVFVDTSFCGENLGSLMSNLSDHCAIVMDFI